MMIDCYHQQNCERMLFLCKRKKYLNTHSYRALPDPGALPDPRNYVFEVTAKVVDTNTLLTVIQVFKNIFLGINIKSISREIESKAFERSIKIPPTM